MKHSHQHAHRHEVQEDLIGLSLSFCIRDIVEKRVPLGRVKLIIAGTNFNFPADISKCMEHYSVVYWNGIEDDAERILRFLLMEKKILQPRNYGFDALNIAHGHWATQTREPS